MKITLSKFDAEQLISALTAYADQIAADSLEMLAPQTQERMQNDAAYFRVLAKEIHAQASKVSVKDRITRIVDTDTLLGGMDS